MAIRFSPVISTQSHPSGRGRLVQSVDLQALGELASPITALDHFRSSAPVFGPRLLAGSSAATYVLQDSQVSLRSRNSLGNDIVMRPGGLVWTQAACGVAHEHLPAEAGREMHGLHFCVSLSPKHRDLGSSVFRLEPEDVPEWHSLSGDRVRVVVGSFAGHNSPVTPADPFILLDVRLRSTVSLPLPQSHNALVYVLAGSALLFGDGHAQRLEPAQAVALHSPASYSILQIVGSASLLILSGAATRDSVLKRDLPPDQADDFDSPPSASMQQPGTTFVCQRGRRYTNSVLPA